MIQMTFDKIEIATKVREIIRPLSDASDADAAGQDRLDGGRNLPPYYLVYFLLVDLLGYRNLGKFEKVAWSIPVSLGGQTFLIEHRKFGLGIFGAKTAENEKAAASISNLIHAGVKVAQPYFDHLAASAASGSNLNVVNRSRQLYDRYAFLTAQYERVRAEYEELRSAEKIRSVNAVLDLSRQSTWYAVSSVDSFFSWTEHVLIHLGIIQGKLQTGKEVADLTEARWEEKFRVAIGLASTDNKRIYDKLLALRRQLRNFVAHGAFGKDGQAFSFHSKVGAVPLLLPHKQTQLPFRFGNGVDFVDHDAIALTKEFVEFLWSAPRSPAEIYLQKTDLPLILTLASDGTYARAMASIEAMTELVQHYSELFERYASMDC